MILRFQKIALHNKIINKTWSTKNQENSTHCFGDNYLTNHAIKFLQDKIKPWRVVALRVPMHWLSLFLKKIVSEGFPTAFNFSHQFISTMFIKAYFVNVVVDMKPICLNKCYLFQNKIYYLDKIYLYFLKIKLSKFTLYKLYKLVTKLVVKNIDFMQCNVEMRYVQLIH